jgi:hypothetical protein
MGHGARGKGHGGKVQGARGMGQGASFNADSYDYFPDDKSEAVFIFSIFSYICTTLPGD